MPDSKTYRRRLADVQAFAAALSRFLEACESNGSDPFLTIYPSWTPKPGREAEAARLAAEVDRVAGRAAVALGQEFFIDWKPRGTTQTQRVSPAASWRTILDYDPSFPADAIFAVCNQAIGVLEARAVDSEEHEQSLAGRMERITGARRTGQPRQEGGHLRTVLITTVLGIVSALIVAYLTYRLGWH